MSEDIQADREYTVARDITIGGKLAFEEGETVTVEKVDPNPSRPDFKYVVQSRLLGRRYQLAARDLEPAGGPEAEPPPGELEEEPEAESVPAARGRGKGWFARHWKAVTACLAAALLAGAAVVVILLVTGGQDPSETLAENKLELQRVVQRAGSTSTSLSVEIQNASRKAPNPEEFAPLGKEIAAKYVPEFQGYYKQVKVIREQLQKVEATPETRALRESLIKAADSYERAMLEYVTALDQIGKGQINEAFATFTDVSKLVSEGNNYLK
jgi:hypothetical protein